MAKQRELQYVIDGYVGSKFNKAFSTVERRMKSLDKVGNKLTTGLTLPMLAAGGAALHMSNKMNEGMANVATLIPGNVARVAELKAGIQDLAPVVGRMTSDLTEGAYQVISAFGDTSDSLALLEINAKAGATGVATTLDAINLTSAVTKAYGDTSADAVRKAADLALMTVRMGQTTFPELAASIGRVTPLTKGLGVTQEELFGVMATATGVTGGAAEVTTQLRGVMQSLMSPTADMTKLLKKYGYANGRAVIESKGLQGAIEFISSEARASGMPLQKYISSIEGQTLALALAGAQSADLTKKVAAMHKVLGTTDVAFGEVTGGVNEAGFKLKQLQAKAEVTGQKVGDALAPALIAVLDAAEPLIRLVSQLADSFTAADPKTQKMILLILGIVAAAGPAIKIVVGLIGAVKGFMAVLAVMKVVMAAAFATTPIGWVVLAIAALITGIILLVKHWDTVKKAMSAAWAWLVKFGTEGAGRFVPIVAVIATIAKNWDKITSAIRTAWEWGKKFIGVAMDIAKYTPVGMAVSGVRKAQKVLARADGGPVQGGRPYLVGERGPELFTPGHSGSIIPNLALAGGGGISIGEINITMPGGSSADRHSAVQVGDAVVEAIRRYERDQRRRSFA